MSVFRNNMVLVFDRALESSRVGCRGFDDYTVGVAPLRDNTFGEFRSVVDMNNAESPVVMSPKISLQLLDTI